MGERTVRTSLDLPASLHSRLHALAARKGCSARQLILRSIETIVEDSEPRKPQRWITSEYPIVRTNGRRPFDLTNDQIYNLIEFPWCERLDGVDAGAPCSPQICVRLVEQQRKQGVHQVYADRFLRVAIGGQPLTMPEA